VRKTSLPTRRGHPYPLRQVPGRDSERSLKASAEVAKVAETVREGRVCDGANLALQESDSARLEPFQPYPPHWRGAECAEQAVEASHRHGAGGCERLGPEVRVVQIRARKPHDPFKRSGDLRRGIGVAFEITNRGQEVDDRALGAFCIWLYAYPAFLT
jgi:hypothetical protein